MNTTIGFIDAVKASQGGISDYRLAKILGITQQTVSKYRTGKDFLGDVTAIKVAALLEIEPAYVLACVHQERSKSDAFGDIIKFPPVFPFPPATAGITGCIHFGRSGRFSSRRYSCWLLKSGRS